MFLCIFIVKYAKSFLVIYYKFKYILYGAFDADKLLVLENQKQKFVQFVKISLKIDCCELCAFSVDFFRSIWYNHIIIFQKAKTYSYIYNGTCENDLAAPK